VRQPVTRRERAGRQSVLVVPLSGTTSTLCGKRRAAGAAQKTVGAWQTVYSVALPLAGATWMLT
jgi:hypothetical protein